MTGPAPLSGRVVLLLRPEERGGDLGRRLEGMGARTIHLPVLAFAPPHDQEAARRALAGLGHYDLVAFTSRTGVAAFLEQVRRPPMALEVASLRAAAIGPGTASELRAAGIEPVLVAAGGGGAGLLAEIERLDAGASTILVVRPEGGGAISFGSLRSRGARVDEVAFYRTVPAAGAPLAASTIAAGAVDAVVFTSPSTLRFLIEAGAGAGTDLRDALRRTRRVAIGPVTADELAAAGLAADSVAADPTPESVCEAVLRALRCDSSVC